MKRNRDEVLRILHERQAEMRRFGVKRLGLFGSCARGDNTETSDLDFLVDMDVNSFDNYMDLKERLEELFGCPVDLVMADNIKPRLRPTILNETIYAQGL